MLSTGLLDLKTDGHVYWRPRWIIVSTSLLVAHQYQNTTSHSSPTSSTGKWLPSRCTINKATHHYHKMKHTSKTKRTHNSLSCQTPRHTIHVSQLLAYAPSPRRDQDSRTCIRSVNCIIHRNDQLLISTILPLPHCPLNSVRGLQKWLVTERSPGRETTISQKRQHGPDAEDPPSSTNVFPPFQS